MYLLFEADCACFLESDYGPECSSFGRPPAVSPPIQEGGFLMFRPLVQISQLSKAFGYRVIFSDINFLIREGEKAALVGPNGIGKTTLLKVLAGLEQPTSGSVQPYKEGLLVKYVPQDPQFDVKSTPWGVLESAEKSLGTVALASAAEAISRFQFTKAEAQLPIENLSGGQKTRLALAAAWLSQPDLLLLDEPTNHLDQAGLDWLQGFVASYPGTVLIVSHDRYFLDQVVSRVIELTSTKANEYQGNYTDYRRAKEQAFQNQMAQYESEQKRIRKIEEAIDRQMRWFEKSHRDAGKNSEIRMGTKEFYRARAKRIARQAKSRIKRLEAMKERSVDKPKAEQTISLTGFHEEASGRRLILAQDLAKSFDKQLFKSANFSVLRGEKVGIVGPNGCGKTTLLKLVLGKETPSAGELWVTPGARIGYLDQELASLDTRRTVLDEVMAVFASHTPEHRTQARTLLGCFLFSADDIDKPVQVLSTGQRKRVALIKLLLSQFNILLLDEPTDHLDLPSREKLEEAMIAYRGALLLVSHDRYLLNRVCDKILAFENGTIVTYVGGYSEYQQAKAGANPKNNRRAEVSQAADRTKGESALSPDERILLETRLARINSELALMSKDDPEYEETEAQFFEIVRKLRS